MKLVAELIVEAGCHCRKKKAFENVKKAGRGVRRGILVDLGNHVNSVSNVMGRLSISRAQHGVKWRRPSNTVRVFFRRQDEKDQTEQMMGSLPRKAEPSPSLKHTW